MPSSWRTFRVYDPWGITPTLASLARSGATRLSTTATRCCVNHGSQRCAQVPCAREVARNTDCLGFLSLGRRRLMQESLQAPTFGGGIREVRRRGRDLFAAVCEQVSKGSSRSEARSTTRSRLALRERAARSENHGMWWCPRLALDRIELNTDAAGCSFPPKEIGTWRTRTKNWSTRSPWQLRPS